MAKLLSKNCKFMDNVQDLIKDLFKETVEDMLESEMNEHLGYDKNSVKGYNTGNSRNGYNKKAISTQYGETEIKVPRDRNGEFEPQVITKYQNKSNDIEKKILAMYAKVCRHATLKITCAISTA